MIARLRPAVRVVRRARTGKLLLVYPERALELNESASEIIMLLDGTRSVADIVGLLCDRHPDAGAGVVQIGVERILRALADRALLDVLPYTP